MILKWLIAGVWIINGLFFKVMNFAPRHELIVARILGAEHSRLLTIVIGILELMLAAWIISSYKHLLCTVVQIVLVLTKNIIEFFLAPDLLLFGKFNLLIAIFFVCILICNEIISRRGRTNVK